MPLYLTIKPIAVSPDSHVKPISIQEFEQFENGIAFAQGPKGFEAPDPHIFRPSQEDAPEESSQATQFLKSELDTFESCHSPPTQYSLGE